MIVKSMKKLYVKLQKMKLNSKFTAIIIIVVLIPIIILASVLFSHLEQNVIRENITYMENTKERTKVQVHTNIDSIIMTTQFFLSDDKMNEILNRAAVKDPVSTAELLDFYDSDVASLERLVNNNPLLYTVRIFATNDEVQEMMPILYKKSRMSKLNWTKEEVEAGWHYGYHDTIFSSLISDQSKTLASLVTPIEDYQNGTIGLIEATITMDTMFPGLYEDTKQQWSCFVDHKGCVYLGNHISQENLDDALLIMENKRENPTEETYYYVNGKKKWIISYLPVQELDGTLICVQDITSDVGKIYENRNFFGLGMLVILLVLTFLINRIVTGLLKQFYEILAKVRIVQNGDLGVRIDRISEDEAGELGNQLNKMLDHIEKLMQDNINREILAKNSEIRALQNQINAHFIYNVLETIKMMAEIDEKYEISDAITSLGKLLRYTMRWVSGNVTVTDELEYIKNYIALINLRFDYEIYLSLNIPEELMGQEIPKMSLQPVVENAILHGIEEMAEDTNIYLKGYVEDGDCYLEITDAGKGMSPEQLLALQQKIDGEIETTEPKGHGIGLKNVQDRITMAFGKEYGVKVDSKLECYTKVTLHLPYHGAEIEKK